MPESHLIDETAAAALLDRPIGTLRWWRVAGRGPRYLKIGRAVRYSLADLRAFLAACTVEPKSGVAA